MRDYNQCPEKIAEDYRPRIPLSRQVEIPPPVPSYQGELKMTEDTKKFIAFVAAVAVVLSVLFFSAAWVGVEITKSLTRIAEVAAIAADKETP